MVNTGVTDAREAERALILSYAPADARPALAAILALDRRLGALLMQTREPMVAQMRLTWWYEALQRLDSAPPPAEPILSAVAAEVLPRGVTGAALATTVDGWEALLAPDPDEAALLAHAGDRGERLFAAATTVLGGALPVAGAGEGWALANLAQRMRDPGVRQAAAALAAPRLAAATQARWPRPLRPLGAMALGARADLAETPPGAARRTLRLMRHRLTGR